MNDQLTLGVDRRAMRSSFERAATSYDRAAILQQEVAQRLVERMQLMTMQPRQILDAGAGTGFCSYLLGARYPKAKIISLDIAHAMLQQAKRKRSLWQRLQRQFSYITAEVEHLPLADASVDLIVSGLTLQWCEDLTAVFREFRRVLAPGGLLLFSSFGPDTLKELRHCWAQADSQPHVNQFLDMHFVGDALLQAGFADPVMDMEHLTVTYADAKKIMLDLKHVGAHNVIKGRATSLTGKSKLQAVYQHYESFRRNGVLPVTHEVVYGHAWVSEQPQTLSSVIPSQQFAR